MAKIKGLHSLKKPNNTRMYRGKRLSFISRRVFSTLNEFKSESKKLVRQIGKKYSIAIAVRQDVVEKNKTYYVLDIYALKFL